MLSSYILDTRPTGVRNRSFTYSRIGNFDKASSAENGATSTQAPKMTFDELQSFIANEMRMSQVYQPVMLIELLRNGGSADVAKVAQAILDRDPTQLEYYAAVVKNMVGRVLTAGRNITERAGNTYKLRGAEQLSAEQIDELVKLCESRIADFQAARGEVVWAHRRRGYRPVAGSIRYTVLSRAGFRCDLCGVTAEEKALEVDHIVPRSLGGKDDIANYQALCFSCNAAKRNTDSTDFRGRRSMYEHREVGCLFCDLQSIDRGRVVAENALAYAIRDGFPVTKGHTLVIPKRHARDYFDLVPAEVQAVNELVKAQRAALLAADSQIEGANIGMNCGEVAGQTVFHCHVHLIPRRRGDVENPRGGVRHVMPGKGSY